MSKSGWSDEADCTQKGTADRLPLVSAGICAQSDFARNTREWTKNSDQSAAEENLCLAPPVQENASELGAAARRILWTFDRTYTLKEDHRDSLKRCLLRVTKERAFSLSLFFNCMNSCAIGNPQFREHKARKNEIFDGKE